MNLQGLGAVIALFHALKQGIEIYIGSLHRWADPQYRKETPRARVGSHNSRRVTTIRCAESIGYRKCFVSY